MRPRAARPESVEGRARGWWFDDLATRGLMALAAALAIQIAVTAQQAPATPDFEARVRPILAANCFDCHAEEKFGGLRLDSREAMLTGGASGPAIVPGDPDKSLLIQAVRQTSEKLKMPKGGRLRPDDIDALTEWVKAGAPWPASNSAGAASAPAGATAPKPYVITPQQRA